VNLHPKFSSILSWAQRNERHLSTAVFIFGFIGDVATFTLIDITYVNLVFMGYLAAAAVFTFLSHTLSSRTPERETKARQILNFVAPLGVQFATGSLLSGFLIYYTKSATFDVSWPFLVLLGLVFLGNEVFRDYRTHLAFQTVLFFFALYGYLIFGLPLSFGVLGPKTFLESTGLAIGIFGLFLFLLSLAGWQRLKQTFSLIVLGACGILAVITISYFTALIPPIPLTLQDAGIYHTLVREKGGYTVSAEHAPAWWHFRTPTIHHVPGTPLFAYSSIFAPGAFTASVAHRWELYDAGKKQWVTKAFIPFPLAGGRKNGYRGYSEILDAQPGQWRVTIETVNGQVIGRIRFTVVSAAAEPKLDLEAK
jgi:hypothetical protein